MASEKWAAAIERYLDAKRQERRSPDTIRDIQRYLIECAIWMERSRRQRDPRQVRTVDAWAWRNFLMLRRKSKTFRGRPLSRQKTRSIFVMTSRFFRFLEDEEAILLNPFRYLPSPKAEILLPDRVLTRSEVRRLLEAPDTRTRAGIRDRAILEALYSSGLRPGEIVALRIADLDLGRGTIFVRLGKGQKDRVVPIGSTACVWIRKYIATARPAASQTDALWLTKSREPLTRDVWRDIFNIHRQTVGLPRATSYSLRHSCATHMIREGAPTPIVQRILGHVKLRTTQIYTRVTIRDLQRVHRRAHPGARRKASIPK